jgi:hypothetical protein
MLCHSDIDCVYRLNMEDMINSLQSPSLGVESDSMLGDRTTHFSVIWNRR